MAKFKIGDRVELRVDDAGRGLKKGDTGEILDASCVPHVKWDKGGKKCAMQGELELIASEPKKEPKFKKGDRVEHRGRKATVVATGFGSSFPVLIQYDDKSHGWEFDKSRTTDDDKKAEEQGAKRGDSGYYWPHADDFKLTKEPKKFNPKTDYFYTKVENEEGQERLEVACKVAGIDPRHVRHSFAWKIIENRFSEKPHINAYKTEENINQCRPDYPFLPLDKAIERLGGQTSENKIVGKTPSDCGDPSEPMTDGEFKTACDKFSTVLEDMSVAKPTLPENTVVHVKTEEECEILRSAYKKIGWNLKSPFSSMYGKETAIRLSKNPSYADREYYTCGGGDIIPLSEALRILKEVYPEKMEPLTSKAMDKTISTLSPGWLLTGVDPSDPRRVTLRPRPHGRNLFYQEYINNFNSINQKTIMETLQTVTKWLKRTLTPGMQSLYRANYITGEGKPTSHGREVLNDILWEEYEAKLVTAAKAHIKEVEAKSKK